MEQFVHLIYELRDHVAWVTLNRPEKLNAVNPQMRLELFAAVDRIRADPQVRCAVITGAGRAFCTGADIYGRLFPYPVEGEEGNVLDGRTSDLRWGWHRILRLLWECEKPIIAAVNGWAVGFGAHLPLYCDLVVASEQAQFMEPWARRGLPIEAAGAYILPRLMPLLKAKEKVFFAEPISAQEALALGLVNKVVPAEELIPTAQAWAARLANLPTRVLGIHKRQLQMALDSTLERSVYDEVTALVLTQLTEDAGEAMRAYREKREPVFTGR